MWRWFAVLPWMVLGVFLPTARGQLGDAAPVEAPTEEVQTLDGPSGIALSENRELRRQLDLIRQQFEGGSFTDAARVAGNWLEDPATEDFFLNAGTGQSGGRSFKSELRRLLGELPPAGRNECQLLFGAAAQAKLADALAHGGGAAFQSVALRYGHTRAGQEALYRLADDHWNHGRPREAAVCWQKLGKMPDAATRFEPLLSVMLAASWQRAGEEDQARAVLANLRKQQPTATLTIGGRQKVALFTEESQAPRWLAGIIPAPQGSPDRAGSIAAQRGDATRNLSGPAQAPLMSPRWYRPLSGDVGARQAIDATLADNARNARTWLPTLFPLVVGNQVIRHTGQTLEAFHLATGEPLWAQPSEAYGNGGSLDQRLWNEAAFGRLSSDGQRLYVVEGNGGEATAIDPDTGEEVVPTAGFNVLTARDVAEPRQGNLRWRVGGPDGGGESSLAGTLFLGPPLPMAGRLYVLAEAKQAIRLVVLDAATGRLEWSQHLADVEPEPMIGALRRAAGATPSIADEIVVCPTSGGGAIAVDLVTQSLVWAYRYACATPTRADPERGTQVDLNQGARWLDGHAILAEGRVVLTSLESQQVHCLDLKSGQPLWRSDRGQYLYVAGVQSGAVLLVGKSQVTALKLADGKPAWTVPLTLPSGSHTSGHGVLAPARYFLPLSSGEIAEIDLTQGRIAATSRSLKQIVPGNLAWHRGALVSLGAQCLEVFDERGPLEQQLRERLEAQPDDAIALARLGEIDLAAGKLDACLPRFRRAYALTPTPRHRNLLIAALHDALGEPQADRPAIEAELDALLP